MSDRTTSTASRENRAREELMTVLAQAESRRAQFLELLPSQISWDSFKDTFKIAVQINPRLLEANRESFWIALQRAAMDGLMPDGREGALVIFGDDSEDEEGNRVASTANKPKRVQWMPMVWGLVKLVRNTGNIANIRTKLVYKGERVEIIDEDGAESYKHIRTIGGPDQINDDPANIVGAYAVVNYKDGFWEMEPMSRAQIDQVRAVSRAKKGPWLPWYDEMAKKTVLRRLIKRLDKSPVRLLEAALDRDDTLTIEGAAETPAQRAIAAPAKPTPVADRPAPDPDRREPEQRQPDPPTEDQRGQQERQQAATDPGKDQPPPAQQEPPRQQPAAGTAVAFFPVDDVGEPFELPGGAEAFDKPSDFAGWVATMMKVTARPEALWENNADALGELKAGWPDLWRLADDAYADAQKRVQEPPAATGTAEDAGQQPDAASGPENGPGEGDGIPPVKVPLTTGGKPSAIGYAKACRAELDHLTTQQDVAAWVNRNFQTYQGRAIEAAIEKHIRETRARIGGGSGAGPDAQQQPAADRDAATADGYLEEIKAMTSLDAGKTFGARGDVVTKMARWERERPELHKAVTDAAAAKMAELKGAR